MIDTFCVSATSGLLIGARLGGTLHPFRQLRRFAVSPDDSSGRLWRPQRAAASANA